MSWSDIFLSVFTGFIGSLLVVLFLYSLRPRLEISPEVSERAEETGASYGFKMINKTPYQIFDVNIIVELITPESVSGGQIIVAKEIKLRSSKFFVVQKFDKTDKESEFAFRVRTYEDIRKLWTSDGQYLRISVVCRHALSGFCGVFQHKYFTRGDIKIGSHQYGMGMHVHGTV